MIINRDDKKVQDINQSIIDIFGYQYNEIIGKNLDAFYYLSPEEKDKLYRNFLLSGEFSDIRSKIIKKSGDSAEIIMSGKDIPVYNLIIVLILDITLDEKADVCPDYQKKTNESSDESEMNRWRHFIDIMSHELRTPLQPALGYLQLLIEDMEKSGGNSRDLNSLKKCLECIKRECYIVEKMLQLGSLASYDVILRVADINLNELVSDIIKIGNYCDKAVFVIDIPEKTVIRGDFDKIYQIIEGIISNAVKYSTGHGRVDISYKTDAENHYFSVKDYGISIPEDCLDKIFEPFFICNYEKNNRKYSRLGLGLSIARRYARAHSGDINVLSSHKEGSTFTFILPKKPPNHDK